MVCLICIEELSKVNSTEYLFKKKMNSILVVDCINVVTFVSQETLNCDIS